jgi:hypothetical protein
MDSQDFSISFRIRHPSIDPAELTRQLGVEPQHAWRAGEPRRSDGDEIGSGAYRETYWVGELAPPQPWSGMLPEPQRLGPLAVITTSSARPQTTLYFTLLRMKRTVAFWRELVEQGGTIECLLSIHNTDGFQVDMSQALLLMLVELKVALSIEVDGSQRTEERAA